MRSFLPLEVCLSGLFTAHTHPLQLNPSPSWPAYPPTTQRKKPGPCPTRPPVPFNKQSVLALRLVVFSLKPFNQGRMETSLSCQPHENAAGR